MLRLLGILALGNLFFGGRRHRGRRLGRGLLLGALLGLFISRANRDRADEYEYGNQE